MIKELTWDSAFFKRRIGELIPASQEPSHIKDALDKAREDGFQYITCKIRSQDTPLIRLLESSGFYLTDIGVILAIKTDAFFQNTMRRVPKMAKSIEMATFRNIPMLKRMIKSLFLESRFYSDPFFSKKEADGLYEAWIENSVKGEAAEAVFYIPKTGFITCRKSGKNSGEIVLIGIRKNLRGKGFGSALVGEAVQWFIKQKITAVTVRTQLKNLKALNFYLSLGFLPKEYDIIFGKIL